MRNIDKSNISERDVMLEFYRTEKGFGGIYHFKGVPPKIIQHLADLRLLDLDDRQNDAPSIGEFVDFALSMPNCSITFHGYAVSADREDCRVSIEGLELKDGGNHAMQDFILFNRHADEFEIDIRTGYARSWWD